jgi:hypothetical protein
MKESYKAPIILNYFIKETFYKFKMSIILTKKF